MYWLTFHSICFIQFSMVSPTNSFRSIAIQKSINEISLGKWCAFASLEMQITSKIRRWKYRRRREQRGMGTRHGESESKRKFFFCVILSFEYDWNMSKGIARASISIIFDEIILMFGFCRFLSLCQCAQRRSLPPYYFFSRFYPPFQALCMFAMRYTDFLSFSCFRLVSKYFVYITNNWYIMCVHALLPTNIKISLSPHLSASSSCQIR